jgi:hypothetical protein
MNLHEGATKDLTTVTSGILRVLHNGVSARILNRFTKYHDNQPLHNGVNTVTVLALNKWANACGANSLMMVPYANP